MKKVLGFITMIFTVMVFAGCSSEEKTTFTQEPLEGTKVTIVVTHKGDKVIGAEGTATFDNKKLQITDESIAEQVVDGFKSTSQLDDAKMTYSDKETVITYKAPKSFVSSDSSFKEASKGLTNAGFKEEK